jgi:hypothetical protein
VAAETGAGRHRRSGSGRCGSARLLQDPFEVAQILLVGARIAATITGAVTLAKPAGSPRLRRVMRVRPAPAGCQVHVVSIGHGPCAARITSRSPGTSSTTSYVYASRRPRNRATKSIRDPTITGAGVCHTTDSMFAHHCGACDGSAAYADTSRNGRSI